MAVLREVDWLEGGRRFPASSACPAPPACSGPRPASRPPAAAAPRRAISSLPAPSPPPMPPRWCASTGRSRTACTGCSTSPSATTSPASARATAPATWPPSATSPSTSSAPHPTSAPSNPAEMRSRCRRFHGEWRFSDLAMIGMIEAEAERNGRTSLASRYYLSSVPLSAGALAASVRAHSGIENRLHWVMEVVVFHDDLMRLRTGSGPSAMATIRHAALNIARQGKPSRSAENPRMGRRLTLRRPHSTPPMIFKRFPCRPLPTSVRRLTDVPSPPPRDHRATRTGTARSTPAATCAAPRGGPNLPGARHWPSIAGAFGYNRLGSHGMGMASA